MNPQDFSNLQSQMPGQQTPPTAPQDFQPRQQMPAAQMVPPENQGEPISDQERQTLVEMIQAIQAKIDQTRAYAQAGNDKAALHKTEMLNKLFDGLTSKGIDLTNVESVNSFLAKLNEVAPDLAQLFQQAIEILLQGEITDQTGMGRLPEETLPEEQNMNIQNSEQPKQGTIDQPTE